MRTFYILFPQPNIETDNREDSHTISRHYSSLEKEMEKVRPNTAIIKDLMKRTVRDRIELRKMEIE